MCYSAMVVQSLKTLENRFLAHPIRQSFTDYEQKTQQDPKRFKPLADHPRIYPGYFASLILSEDKERVIRPMRYRMRPSWAETEIPTKYNVFNARLDSLETRKSWQGIFMRQHGLLVFEKFYEWVADEATGKKKIVSFYPADRDLMWAPCLWDRWTDGEQSLESFAIITTDPPPEISEAGHDRCPLFLREDLIDTWLNPKGMTKKEMYKVLAQKEGSKFLCGDATA